MGWKREWKAIQRNMPRAGERFTLLVTGDGNVYKGEDGRMLSGMETEEAQRDILWNASNSGGVYAPPAWRRKNGFPDVAVYPVARSDMPESPSSGPRVGDEDGVIDIEFAIVNYRGSYAEIDAALKKMYAENGWTVERQGMAGVPLPPEPEKIWQIYQPLVGWSSVPSEDIARSLLKDQDNFVTKIRSAVEPEWKEESRVEGPR